MKCDTGNSPIHQLTDVAQDDTVMSSVDTGLMCECEVDIKAL